MENLKKKSLIVLEPSNCLTMGEVTYRFRISRSTMYRLIKAGKVKPIKIGGSLRFPMEEVLRIENEGTDKKNGSRRDI